MVFRSLLNASIHRQTIGKQHLNAINPFKTIPSSYNFRKFPAHYNCIHSMASFVERVSEMFIKPSSPTPQSLSRYILSSYDQRMPSTYPSLAFFYPNPGLKSSTFRQQLQNSISKILVSYYPLAGRLVENDHIHCNDEGIEFVEVRLRCPIYDIVKHVKSNTKDLVLLPRVHARCEGSLAVVQLTHFDCGGVAVALGISHKVADGSTLVAFMKDLATSACLPSHVPAPVLVSDSVFPHRDDVLPASYVPPQDCVARRFIFPPAEVQKLKLKAVESGIQKPSRVEVVTALLYRCAMIARTSTNCGFSQPFALFQPINLRPFLGLPQNSVGNIVAFNFIINEDDRMEFPELIGQLKKANLRFKKRSREELTYESQMKELKISGLDVQVSSSLCGFPIYDIDFGWGKPIWVCFLQPQVKDATILMDSPGNGVEAFVTLEKEMMAEFENNEQLLSFASSSSANV